MLSNAVPWLRRLVAGLSPRKPGFDPVSVYVGFVVEKVALGQVFPRVLRFYPVNLIPPVFHWKLDFNVNVVKIDIFKPVNCARLHMKLVPIMESEW